MIPTKTASGRRFAFGDVGRAVLRGALVLGLALVAGLGCSNDNGGDDAGNTLPDGREGPACPFDEIGEAEQAEAIEIDSAKTGHICPIQDEDWYEFSLGEGRQILDVSLGYSTPLTSVQPAYRIWSTAGGETDEVVGSSPAEESATELQRQHCLGQGDYKVVVYDRDHDDEDRRRQYSLQLGLQENPDQQEPNDARDSAVAMQPGDSKTGYIACRGDHDWYTVDVPDGNVLRFELTSEQVDYQPRVEVLGPSGDETVYATASNEQAGGRKTQIERFAVVPEGGTYFLRVSDTDDDEADASVPYTLTVDIQSDADQNEPNDQSGEATELTDGESASCGAGWSRTYETIGTIGDEQDQDWYRVPLEGCGNGIVDAEVELQGGGNPELNQSLELRLRMVRPHGGTDCASNDDCGVIEAECDRNLDCRGLGGACDQDRAYCTGGIDQCMPSDKCGVIQVQRQFPCTPDRAPYRDECGTGELSNRADIGAPLPDTDAVYFQVSDVGFDGAAPDVPYSIRVRVHEETDPNEVNNVYIADDALFDNHHESVNHQKAKQVPVYDCTTRTMQATGDTGADGGGDTGASDGGASDGTSGGDDTGGGGDDTGGADDTGGGDDTGGMSMDTGNGMTDTGGGGGDELVDGCCAMDASWTTGAISYDNDVDHFEYQHPCPGGDCVMNFHYRIDRGSVDHIMNVLRSGSSPWYSLAAQCEQADHDEIGPTVSGAAVAGGQPNICFYAYQGHGSEEDPHTYGFKVEDRTDEFEDNAFKPATRDWDPGQQYEFCIEKVADGCPGPPCGTAENGECDGGGSPNEHCSQ